MKLPKLSLDCLTLTDASPVQLVDSAKAAGFDLVSLWTYPVSQYPGQVVTFDNVDACVRRLAELGIGVHSIDAIELSSIGDAEAVGTTLELGARLGGQAVLAYHYADIGRAAAADALARLGRMAADFGLGVMVEPIAMGQTRTVFEARDLIALAGTDARILFDTYHFIRGGCEVAQLEGFDTSLIGYVQINDGVRERSPDEWMKEATQDRLFPGEGEFPLVELLRLMPRDVPWGIEAPQLSRQSSGVSPDSLAMEAYGALSNVAERALT